MAKEEDYKRKMLVMLYNALVIPILTYNANSIAATVEDFEKLNICQRRHLRRILGLIRLDKISNVKLYEKSRTIPISITIMTMRWQYFGKILRMPEDSPPQQALIFAIIGSKKLKSRRGRHQTNLYETLKKEVENNLNIKLDTENQLSIIKEKAKDVKIWNELYDVCKKSINVECESRNYKQKLKSHAKEVH